MSKYHDNCETSHRLKTKQLQIEGYSKSKIAWLLEMPMKYSEEVLEYYIFSTQSKEEKT